MGLPSKLGKKKHLVLSKEQEQELWDKQMYLHLNYTIDKTGKLKNVVFREKLSTSFQKKVLDEMKQYPVCTPHLENGKPSDAECQYIFHVHQAEPQYKRDLSYLRILEDDYPELKAEKIDHIDNLELKYHIFNIRKLGWIAAAQALEQPTSVDLVIKVEPTFLAEVKIMLEKSKIILKGKRDGNKVSFLGLPKNEAIQIIAFGEKRQAAFIGFYQGQFVRWCY